MASLGASIPVQLEVSVGHKRPDGMTARDWLACHAPRPEHDYEDVEETEREKLVGRPRPSRYTEPLAFLRWMADYDAIRRYVFADAMLRARLRVPEVGSPSTP